MVLQSYNMYVMNRAIALTCKECLTEIEIGDLHLAVSAYMNDMLIND